MKKLMTLVMAMALAGSQFVASSAVKADLVQNSSQVDVCEFDDLCNNNLQSEDNCEFTECDLANVKEGKVIVCHIPPGNPNNAHEIIISKNALETHLKHGDTEGCCVPIPPPETQPEGPVCGNEEVESGEACDDGNKVNGDGCENDCTVTPPETQPEDPVCGNEEVESGEVCDDGNQVNGDGCENDCTVTPENPPVEPICGNGAKESGEACDDGNKVNGDGCENDCTVTPEHHCDDPMPEVPQDNTPQKPGPDSDPGLPNTQDPTPQSNTPNPPQLPSSDDLRRTAALVGSGGNAESAMGCSLDMTATAANSTGAWISLASLFTFLGVRRRINKK